MIEATREQVSERLRIYMSRTGLTAMEIAYRSGYSTQTLRQFISGGRFGSPPTEAGPTAAKLAAWLNSNPAPLPEFPGKLYETDATREMDRMLAHAASSGWGILYGPAGAQKTFLLKFRVAESAREAEPWLVLVDGEDDMSPRVLLSRIAQGLGAPYAWGVEPLREAIFYTLRRRKDPVAIVIDEAQLLYSRVDTLETLRRLADRAMGKVGILVCGNEQVIYLFEKRRNNYFEQWRSRIEQDSARVLGPSVAESRKIGAAEVPDIKPAALEAIIEGATVADPVSKGKYVNARRLFNALRAFQRGRKRLN
jgi:transcriptional regulator with XRE-family HTH domain